MPAIKEHWKKRQYREKMIREHERKPKEPKKPERQPSCRGCTFFTVKQVYKTLKKRGSHSLRWQCCCVHPGAMAKGNSAMGPPQVVDTLDDVKLRKRRPKWCPIRKEDKVGEYWPDESISE